MAPDLAEGVQEFSVVVDAGEDERGPLTCSLGLRLRALGRDSTLLLIRNVRSFLRASRHDSPIIFASRSPSRWHSSVPPSKGESAWERIDGPRDGLRTSTRTGFVRKVASVEKLGCVGCSAYVSASLSGTVVSMLKKSTGKILLQQSRLLQKINIRPSNGGALETRLAKLDSLDPDSRRIRRISDHISPREVIFPVFRVIVSISMPKSASSTIETHDIIGVEYSAPRSCV